MNSEIAVAVVDGDAGRAVAVSVAATGVVVMEAKPLLIQLLGRVRVQLSKTERAETRTPQAVRRPRDKLETL